MENANGAQPKIYTKKIWLRLLGAVLLLVFLTSIVLYSLWQQRQKYDTATFAMDTMITQSAYGRGAKKAMQELNVALAAYETRLSLFKEESDIARINAGAGVAPVEVSAETAALLQQAVALSAKSEGVFAVTIAPLTLAWGITTNAPRVPTQEEIAALLPLVDDSLLQMDGNRVFLPQKGMGIDLGGIAKGAACTIAADIYEKYNIKSAILSIGGNIYVRGVKPDGSKYRIGFRDPSMGEGGYMASFTMQDKVIAVSGGYERFFEEDGKTYIHILNPQTGWTAESDILSVGAIHTDGAVADFYSTTLFMWGKERTLLAMQRGVTAILLDKEGKLYVSESLKEGFKLAETAQSHYEVEYVPGG